MDYLLPFIAFWVLSTIGCILSVGGVANGIDSLALGHERAWGWFLAGIGLLFSIAAAALAAAVWGA